MPMVPSALKAKIKATIQDGLKAQFSGETGKADAYDSVAAAMHEKLAEAISGIALDIVMEITTNAMVNPGIPTAGGPVSQVTVAPGTIS
jgi:hypothetical protein